MSKGMAVVTGGSGGIGKACARLLRDRGYQVVVAARRAEPLRAAAAELGVDHVVADCAHDADVQRLAARVDGLAVLVHAAGVLEGTRMREQPVEVFDRVLAANLRSAYLVTAALLPLSSAGSRLVYISSTAARGGVPGLTAYSSSKAALDAFARTVASEVEGDGINVHTVTPAPVDTAMLADPQVGMHVLEPEDVASAVGWLESLPPRVVVRELVMRAARRGPHAGRVVGRLE